VFPEELHAGGPTRGCSKIGPQDINLPQSLINEDRGGFDELRRIFKRFRER